MIWMLVTCVFFLLCALLVRLLWLSSYGPETPPEKTVEQCEAALCVFRLLIDPREERYLRATLSQGEFRGLQRKRLWLALRCLIVLDRNVTLLAATGHRAALTDDPNLAQSGEQLTAGALQLKVNLLATEAAVAVKWLFPNSPVRLRLVNFTVQQRVPSLAGR
jgi:hypothetical protein